MYNVLIPEYTKNGKMKISVKGVIKEVDNFDVSWKKIGTAMSLSDAKKKFPKVLRPVLESIIPVQYKEYTLH